MFFIISWIQNRAGVFAMLYERTILISLMTLHEALHIIPYKFLGAMIMNIIVNFVSKYGKDLFYPISDDAKFLTSFTGKPTLSKKQLKIALDKGWRVHVQQSEFNIVEYLESNNTKIV